MEPGAPRAGRPGAVAGDPGWPVGTEPPWQAVDTEPGSQATTTTTSERAERARLLHRIRISRISLGFLLDALRIS